MRKAAGDIKDEDTQLAGGNVQRLVTADGTYATQSVFSTAAPSKKEEDKWVTMKLKDTILVFLSKWIYWMQFKIHARN